MVYRVDIKPLSVNEAWKGRRFKSNKYKVYEPLVFALLPKNITIPKGKILLKYEFGFSNSASDIDNGVKSFTDILQKKYKFNDSRIYRMEIDKVIVKKGFEYIKFEILDFS